MSKERIFLVAAAALVVGIFGSQLVNAHDHGGGGHHYSQHSDGNGGTWHMRDDQTRHCSHTKPEEKAHTCTDWN